MSRVFKGMMHYDEQFIFYYKIKHTLLWKKLVRIVCPYLCLTQKPQYHISVLFSPHLMQITSCFAASAAQSQVTSKTTTRFRTKLSKICNFSPRLHKKRSKILDPPQMLLTITPQVERVK